MPTRAKIIAGLTRSFYIDENGVLYGTGNNANGALGIGSQESPASFTRMATLPKGKRIINVSTGIDHSIVLLEDGTLWAAGDNSQAQLGLGTASADHYLSFVQITTLPIDKRVALIVCSGNHSWVVLEDGSLWGAGCNLSGQLGLGATQYAYVFTKITTFQPFRRVINIATNNCDTIILLDDNSLWATGQNKHNVWGLNSEGAFYQFTSIKTFPAERKAVLFALSDIHSLIMCLTGTLLGAGNNRFGSLGLDTQRLDVSRPYKSIEDKDEQFFLYAFSEITTLPRNKAVIKVVASNHYSMVLLHDGTAWITGINYNYDANPFNENKVKTFNPITLPKNKKIVDIALGYGHKLLLTEEGSLWVAGANDVGQLGLGDRNSREVFTECDISDLRDEFLLVKKPVTLYSMALAKYSYTVAINPYQLGAFDQIVNQTNEAIASEIFMPHLLGCQHCKRYVKPTVWGQCPYPHRPASPRGGASAAGSTTPKASGTTGPAGGAHG